MTHAILNATYDFIFVVGCLTLLVVFGLWAAWQGSKWIARAEIRRQARQRLTDILRQPPQ